MKRIYDWEISRPFPQNTATPALIVCGMLVGVHPQGLDPVVVATKTDVSYYWPIEGVSILIDFDPNAINPAFRLEAGDSLGTIRQSPWMTKPGEAHDWVEQNRGIIFYNDGETNL